MSGLFLVKSFAYKLILQSGKLFKVFALSKLQFISFQVVSVHT